MDRYQSMRIFVAVAEGAGFAGAARKLGLSPPAVTRAVAALEARLGILLLHRTTRIVRPTEAGERYLADCRRILAEIDEAEASATGAHLRPSGTLSVTAPVMFGRLHVTPIVLGFLDLFPDVAVRTLMLDRVVDIIEEGIDVAIRIAAMQDSSLMSAPVGHIRRVVCAAPSYLARRGHPAVPADLMQHDMIFVSSSAAPQTWAFGTGRDDRARDAQRVTLVSRLMMNANEAAIDAAIAGYGIVRALSYQVAGPLKQGKLDLLLADFEPPPIPVQVVHAEGRRASARVRAFVDYAAARLRADPALDMPR